jgi:DNA primase
MAFFYGTFRNINKLGGKMAKAPADITKYNIYADITIDGVVEKPDVVGAIFGQSEGLLGEGLELRDLQKTGRIGRIEVDIKTKVGKSIGTVIVPSSLDMVETSIIGAAIETVDRVGPCNAKILVREIEDARASKRKAVINRAKELLKKLMDDEIPESMELTEEVKKSVQRYSRFHNHSRGKSRRTEPFEGGNQERCRSRGNKHPKTCD